MNRAIVFDTIVVGVGGMGSATCYQLAKSGQKVLGIEQFDIPHNFGSSHGHTRIIRMAYFEGPSYVPLLRRAYQLWGEIEQETGSKIFYKTGAVDIGAENSSVFSGSVASCNEHNLSHEIISAKELNKRYPGYVIPDNLKVNYSPDGGFLLPEKSIVGYVECAQQKGAVIKAREKVIEWKSTGNGVEVKTNKNTYQADKLVFTAGAWNADLLPLLKDIAVPERQVLAWLQPQTPELFEPERFPVFVMDVAEGNFYGFPVFGVPGFKFGKFRHLLEDVHPDTMDREPNAADENVLRSFAQKYFPQGSGPVMSLKTCMFTNTPDNHFIIDIHPEHPQVSFAAGFSGHGFKFVSVMGEIMAELAMEGGTRHDIEMFGLGRF